MRSKLVKNLQAYRFPIILCLSILAGGFLGHELGPKAVKLKPVGDIFLNLLFTVVVPLVFFSLASAFAGFNDLKKMWKMTGTMLTVFVVTSVLAAVFMLLVTWFFPPAQGVVLNLGPAQALPTLSLGEQLVNIFTVSDFIKLFSRENMLALIIFSGLVGFATAALGEKGRPFAGFLRTGMDVFMKAVSLIMYYAPVGFFAYFAVLAGEAGPELLSTYSHVALIYYAAALFYFVVVFTLYAYFAGKKEAVKAYWSQISLPSLTALATCSSAASLPVNLQAAQNMKVPVAIYEVVIPVGTLIHKDGSVLGAILRITFLFGIFQMSFSSPDVLLFALLISLLVGIVIGSVPSGGLIGDLLILSVYGFPPQAFMVIAAISIIIDAPATLLNVAGNTVCSLLVTRLAEGKRWLSRSPA